jgi:hypothetical protein
VVQRYPSTLQVPCEQRNLIFSLCVARILSLDPSVSCYWYRRHRTLWRQWWIWPSSPSPPLWNLTTVRCNVTGSKFSYTKSEDSTISYLVPLTEKFLSTTNQRMLNWETRVDATRLPKLSLSILGCLFFIGSYLSQY